MAEKGPPPYTVWARDFPEPASLVDAQKRLLVQQSIVADVNSQLVNPFAYQRFTTTAQEMIWRHRAEFTREKAALRAKRLELWIDTEDLRITAAIVDEEFGDLSSPLGILRAMNRVMDEIIEDRPGLFDDNQMVVKRAAEAHLELAYRQHKEGLERI